MITFRQAVRGDVDAIAEIYGRIFEREERGETTTGWIRHVYPTRETALAALAAGDLYVAEEDGAVAAAARINREQVPAYANAAWETEASPEQVLVLHTLVVDPARGGRGIGSAFVRFYEDMARERGCVSLRMDTNERNRAARGLYAHLGFREAGIVPCSFNGIPGVRLVCLEKTL